MLPIHEALPALKAALAEHASVVLIAPPGAGKTTVAPLALLDEAWLAGRRIIVLEPRRLAARAAARRMADTLGERPGETVGYRVRMESRVGPKTRIEVATEGVFTRMILDDPASPPSCSTNSTSAAWTPISAWRWRGIPKACCARTSDCWSCPRRSTAVRSPVGWTPR